MATATKEVYLGTGRRKSAVARVRLSNGTGKVTINGKDGVLYNPMDEFQMEALSPLVSAELKDQVDVIVNVQGGGFTGQAGAIELGIARALEKMNPDLRVTLKKPGHLSRDPRAKERKKAGQPGARKKFQFSKR